MQVELSEAGSSGRDIPALEPTSIRGYRSRKVRPCDNCRARRQRCIIEREGQPCTLCVTTKKRCTFLSGRRKSAKEREVDSGSPSLPDPLVSLPSFPSRDSISRRTSALRYRHDSEPLEPPYTHLPNDVPSPATSAHPTCSSLIASIMECDPGGSLGVLRPTAGLSDREPRALDDEADDDEELYLVGTASERDALMLNALAGSTDVTEPGIRPPRSIPGVRVRRVSPNVNFVFYKSKPYGNEAVESHAWAILNQTIGADVIPAVLDTFFRIEGRGHPIWPATQFGQAMNPALKAFCVTAGLIYMPTLRHLHHDAYVATMSSLRQQSPRARLWTIQVYLMDLDGRESINPSGNFVILGQAISVARLLGLHEDCSSWQIPQWEKDLRRRLWWSLLVYDRFAALVFGRQRSLTSSNTVALPTRTAVDTKSDDAFISKCELAILLEELEIIPTCSCQGGVSRISRLSTLATHLDQWKVAADSRLLFDSSAPPGELAPGTQALYLLYLGARVMIVRAVWDALASEAIMAQAAARGSCLSACQALVEFIASLKDNDLRGYWSSHSPFILSLCLTLLVRIIVSATPSESSLQWSAIVTLQGYIGNMKSHQSTAQWDPADLTMSRAQYFIPLLIRKRPELGHVLTPINDVLHPPADDSLDQFLRTLVDYNGLEELWV